MSNPLHIQTFLDSKVPMLLIVEETLNEWKGEGCYQLPSLLGQVQLKMNWDDKELRANDPIIREYIRKHSEWDITRGAFGGVVRASIKREKEAVKAAKAKVKAEITAELEAQVVAKKAALAAAAQQEIADTSAIDNTNSTTGAE